MSINRDWIIIHLYNKREILICKIGEPPKGAHSLVNIKIVPAIIINKHI